jgi:hypothetical protein
MDATDIASQPPHGRKKPCSITKEIGPRPHQSLKIRRTGNFFRDDRPAAKESHAVLAAMRDNVRNRNTQLAEVHQVGELHFSPISAERFP